MASLGLLVDLPKDASFAQLGQYVRDKGIDAVVCGPEGPLADGLAEQVILHTGQNFDPELDAVFFQGRCCIAKGHVWID